MLQPENFLYGGGYWPWAVYTARATYQQLFYFLFFFTISDGRVQNREKRATAQVTG